MKAVAIVLAGMTALAADVGWEFANATHAPDKAEGPGLIDQVRNTI